VRERVNVGMVDFEMLSPTEKAVVGRALFVYTWLRGASAYPFKVTRDMPVRTAATVHAAEEAEYKDLGPRPQWLQTAFEAAERAGGYANIVNPASTITPTTPYEVMQTLGGVVSNESSGRTVGSMLNPLYTGLFDVANRQYDWGEGVIRTSYSESAKRNLEGITPGLTFARGLIGGGQSDLYRPGRWELTKRRVFRGTLPYGVKVSEMRERAPGPGKGPAHSRRKLAARKLVEKAQPFADSFQPAYAEPLRRGQLPPDIRREMTWWENVTKEIHDKKLKSTDEQAAEIAMNALAKKNPEMRRFVPEALAAMRRKEITPQQLYNRARTLGRPRYELLQDAINDLNEARIP
jgi:hypothetical protein